MTYIIYGDQSSGAFSTEAALAEAGADYEFRRVSLRDNAQREPDFLKVNPSGKMPALVLPGGEVLTESAAILFALAERHPDAGLLPPPASFARAEAYRWIVFLACEVYPMVEIADYPHRFVPPIYAGARHPENEDAEALRVKARERIRERLLIVEKAVAGPWLLASGFSAADIYVAMFTRWRDDLGADWLQQNPIPKLTAIAKGVSERPRIAPVWQRHFGHQTPQFF
jgi:glutathione S-transferase